MINNLHTIYLSFAVRSEKRDGTGFLGGVFVTASSFDQALEKVNSLGINPGGHVSAAVYPPVKPELMNRLLSKQELIDAFGSVERTSERMAKGLQSYGLACEHTNKASRPEDAN